MILFEEPPFEPASADETLHLDSMIYFSTSLIPDLVVTRFFGSLGTWEDGCGVLEGGLISSFLALINLAIACLTCVSFVLKPVVRLGWLASRLGLAGDGV
ncbi:hypothetical protein BDV10DRAFT_179418, partial [Aspergillus recurvatus]